MDAENLTLPELRQRLAEAKIALRYRERGAKIGRALAEHEIIAKQYQGDEKNMGLNAEQRARTLVLALALDEEWLQVSLSLEAAHDLVERLSAQVEALLDDRRERQLASQDRYSDALIMVAGAPNLWPYLLSGLMGTTGVSITGGAGGAGISFPGPGTEAAGEQP